MTSKNITKILTKIRPHSKNSCKPFMYANKLHLILMLSWKKLTGSTIPSTFSLPFLTTQEARHHHKFFVLKAAKTTGKGFPQRRKC